MLHSASLTIFFIGASLAGAVFFVSFVELILTIRRRKAEEAIQAQIKTIKNTFNDTINKVVMEDEAKIDAAEKTAEEVAAKATAEQQRLAEEYHQELLKATSESKAALEKARARAKHLEEEARKSAAEYLATRTQEVEGELMNLVMHVTKKVLPSSLDYKAQKELVLQALRDVKAEK